MGNLLPAVYVVAIAIEAMLGSQGLIHARYSARDALASIAMGAGNVVLNLAMAGMVYATLAAGWHFRLLTVSATDPWAWLALFVLDDLTYYWFHRISHECRFWWAAHVNHHSSRYYNLSTALRQNWTGLLVGTELPWVLLAIIGFPPQMILAQQGVSLFYQFWIHTEAVDRLPSWLEYVFNTPSHHRVHHASNARYLDRNYGGILILWDRLFGTFAEEVPADPPTYGIVHNIATFNPLRIAFHEWQAIGRDALTARSGREFCGILFGPPGWRADGTGETSTAIRAAWNAAAAPPPGAATKPSYPAP